MSISAKDVLDRLAKLANSKTDKELADYVGISSSNISTWRSRDTIPYDACLKISERDGISIDWLLTGKGSIYKVDYSIDSVKEEQTVLELYRALSMERRHEILSILREKKSMEELLRRMVELERLVEHDRKTA
ncbi:helix-turn-helix transcriptional regulator [Beggiatoa leptomitoformis]|uniref:Bacteriophage CI repressor N-terminal domain-containing protein n=1 Tax=Beggiatoa leptomitoformis TaxID=288004 RepID=A0A2N9YG33_9GAMM|nr:helix-turn-helix transcriptional regulator [Beggiatoa leptomitoformis]ALG68234.1 hypothetical protein AL038_11585 [Beggiatoa leptomitoformis]AUI69460.1 hypothetical protein BLE401_12690 [Beggiatoa leptomitoformis]